MTPERISSIGEQAAAPPRPVPPAGPVPPARPVAGGLPAEAAAAAPANGEYVDPWTGELYVDPLTRELGREPTWEERAERARAAAKRLGVPPPPQRPPLPPISDEELAAMEARTNSISDAIREEAKGWQFDSTRYIRDMRAGKVDDAPDAYWRPPASDHAGA